MILDVTKILSNKAKKSCQNLQCFQKRKNILYYVYLTYFNFRENKRIKKTQKIQINNGFECNKLFFQSKLFTLNKPYLDGVVD